MPTLEQIKALECQRRDLDSKSLSDKEAQLLYDDYAKRYGDCEAPKDVSAFHGGWELVGQRDAFSSSCGKFKKWLICDRVELHNRFALDDMRCHGGDVFRHAVHYSCYLPQCRVCYTEWAKKEANIIEQRLKVGSLRFGKVEHVIVSPPQSDWGLAEFHNDKFLAKVRKLCFAVGYIGGATIFHGFSYYDLQESLEKGALFGWNWHPHVHKIGFIMGGYGKCRSCNKYVKRYRTRGGKWVGQHGSVVVCVGCDGFEARVRREGKKTGYIIKCMDERASVFGTAFYQLEHSARKVV